MEIHIGNISYERGIGRRIEVWDHPGAKNTRSSPKANKSKKASSMAHVVECVPSKCKALSSKECILWKSPQLSFWAGFFNPLHTCTISHTNGNFFFLYLPQPSSTSMTLFLYFFLYCMLCGGTLWHIQSFLKMCQLSHTWIHPFLISPLSLPSPIHGTVSTVIIFAFTFMCTHYLHHIHSPPPFLITPFSHWC
jgi:hypothetical protein